MGQRRIGQLGRLDAALSCRGGGRREAVDESSRPLDWSAFDQLLAVIPLSAKSEPSFPALMMFKVLRLQRWARAVGPRLWKRLCSTG